jgi:hypothetical protein
LPRGDLFTARGSYSQRQTIAGNGNTRLSAFQVYQRDGRFQADTHIRPQAASGQREQRTGVARMMSMGPDRSPRTLSNERGFDGFNGFIRLSRNRLTGHHKQGAVIEQ